MDTNFYVIGLIDILALNLLVYIILNNDTLGRERKLYFKTAIFLCILTIFAEMCSVLTTGSNHGSMTMVFHRANQLSNVIGFACSPLIALILTEIFDPEIVKRRRYLLIPSIVNIVLVVMSIWGGYVFQISDQNQYLRGDFFFVFIITYLFNMGMLSFSFLITVFFYCYRIRLRLFGLFLFILIGTSIQILFPVLHTSWHCITISIILYYNVICEFEQEFDALTRIYNRKIYDLRLEKLEDVKEYTFVMIDADAFKTVNDTCGHTYGDYCLRELAQIIKRCFGRNGTAFRIGGDEFCVISLTTDEAYLKKMIKDIEQTIGVKRKEDSEFPTLSFGYSIKYLDMNVSVQEIINRADESMYQNKKNKKNEKMMLYNK